MFEFTKRLKHIMNENKKNNRFRKQDQENGISVNFDLNKPEKQHHHHRRRGRPRKDIDQSWTRKDESMEEEKV